MNGEAFRRTRNLLVVVALALALAGCGSKTKPEPDPTIEVSRRDPNNPSTPGGGVPDNSMDPETISELADIHFDFDQYDLRGGDREILTNNGRWLTDNGSTRVLIEGHCDERGTVEYNLALGEKRARTARDFLASYGISQDRLDIISYGKERPLDPRGSEEAWSVNRRCHFVKR